VFTGRGVAIAFSVSEGITEVTSNADSDDAVPKSACRKFAAAIERFCARQGISGIEAVAQNPLQHRCFKYRSLRGQKILGSLPTNKVFLGMFLLQSCWFPQTRVAFNFAESLRPS
jgi:hypothetical protein